MKTKLLKKVRKRFEIYHHPKGIIRYENYYEGVIYTLYDNKTGREYRASIGKNKITHFTCTSGDDCIHTLKKHMLFILNEEGYPSKKRNQIVNEKIWFK